MLGSDSGQANDFQTADGTVIPQPLSSRELYGAFADAWRVTQGSSLMNYLAGQTTATFTDVNFPADSISVNVCLQCLINLHRLHKVRGDRIQLDLAHSRFG